MANSTLTRASGAPPGVVVSNLNLSSEPGMVLTKPHLSGQGTQQWSDMYNFW